MARRFARRADLLERKLSNAAALAVHKPDAGMFALIDISATGRDDHAYALDLLESHGVATMPGTSFGASLAGWLRVALTVEDATLERACNRIVAHANSFRKIGIAS